MKKRILVAEDDPPAAALLEKILGLDYEIVSVEDGAEALWEVQQGPPLDLVMVDLMMPEMDGTELIKELKSNPKTKGIPIIIVTAKDRPKDIIDGINLGARHYIVKPYKGNEILEKVRKILDR